jgi:hypothetical protein
MGIGRKPRHNVEKPHKCHILKHKFYMICYGMEFGLHGGKPATSHLSYAQTAKSHAKHTNKLQLLSSDLLALGYDYWGQ